MYNGHKRVHSMKFQSVALPNGLISNLAGPYEGKHHDSMMLNESGLLPPLDVLLFMITSLSVSMVTQHIL